MDILFIAPEFPENYANFVRCLHAEGIRVWAVGEADFNSLPEDVRRAIRWYARVNLNDRNAVGRASDQLLNIKKGQGFGGAFDWVESHNEAWLRLEAFLNERHGVSGITLRDLDRLKKKSVMKQVFREAGLGVARGGLVTTLEGAIRMAEELGYPIILKPNEGVGTYATHQVLSRVQLMDLFPTLGDGCILEEFIAAPIVTYDGLTDLDGRIVFESSLVYGEGTLEYALGKDTFFYVHRHVPPRLRNVGEALVARFGVKRKFFHFEFFSVGEDYIPMEINCRPPGGSILDMMNYSIDGDLYRAWARMLLGRPTDLPREKKYFVGFVGRKAKPHRLSHDGVRARLGAALVEYAENPPLFWQVMGRYRYLFRDPDEGQVLALAEAAREEAGPT